VLDRYESTFCGILIRTDGGAHYPVVTLVSVSLDSSDLMDAQQSGSGTIRSARCRRCRNARMDN